MNTIIKTLITLTITLSFFGCADKVPFKEQDPLENSALVYVYANKILQDNDAMNMGKYFLQINRIGIDKTLVENEYTAINLKASKNVQISATRSALITKDIDFSTESGKTYFFRINTLPGGDFEFEEVDSTIGLKEIKKTKLSGSILEKKIESLIYDDDKEEKEPIKVAPKVEYVSKSKIEKIKEAHKLKEEGILTEEEFKKLKTEILNAD
ncbi:hypothetical protein FJR48_11105 [Sulfurimonas lithotrophica]|uniref:SHOCT domain-containing protein n=1 Tax=Sulfurimonas lithotrophica TaxID=2590022 RepID=A0A5P8P3R9_9BACT|nr:hypothetical protein [Sulfurimonas lithotrophica]QFR50247.1 hypothetical protein FJR48_11105 [Sulfurimonas lithotrophica]